MPEQIDGDSYAHFWVFLGGCCMCCLGWILVENFGMSNGAAAATTIAVTIPTVIFAVSRLAKAEAAFNAKELAEEAKAHGLTLLDVSTVKPPTARKYQEALAKFTT